MKKFKRLVVLLFCMTISLGIYADGGNQRDSLRRAFLKEQMLKREREKMHSLDSLRQQENLRSLEERHLKKDKLENRLSDQEKLDPRSKEYQLKKEKLENRSLDQEKLGPSSEEYLKNKRKNLEIIK